MADIDYDYTPPWVGTAYEQEIVMSTLREHQQRGLMRYNFEEQWQETAALIYPEMQNTFRFISYQWPGQKKTQNQVDASGMLVNHRHAAICESLLSPSDAIWHLLQLADPYVMKDRSIRLWCEKATEAIFSWRYRPNAGFRGQQHVNYLSLGAFGNQNMFIDEMWSPFGKARGIRYRSCDVGSMYYKENHQGIVDDVIRWFRLTAAQALEQFGWLPEFLRAPYKQGSTVLYDFLHWVCPNVSYDEDQFASPKGKRFRSCYICVSSKSLMKEGGYRAFPYAIGRYTQAPTEIYGRGWAQMVLPALKTLNAQKQDFLKVGHRTADPMILTRDDGVLSADQMVAGVIVPGLLNDDGKLMAQPFPVGNMQITKEMMDEERGILNDMGLVRLFQILEETPQMSATEVIERANEKGILIAPVLGRQVEYFGPMIEREIDILEYQGCLPPKPPALLEAIRAQRAEIHVEYTSPLAKMAKSGEAAGFLRTVEVMSQVAQATGDPSVFDFLSFERAGPALADISNVPESWMATPQEMAQKKKGRADAAKTDQQIKMAPANAAVMKAQAVVEKTRMQIGGQPQGGGQFPQGPQQQGAPDMSQQGAGM